MDVLTSMLNHLHSSAALVGTNILTPPWSIRFEDTPSLSIITMLRGSAWIITDPGPQARQLPTALAPGDLAVIRGAAPFTIASAPEVDVPPLYVLADPSTCTDGAGRVLDPGELMVGVRSCGARLDGDQVLLAGSYRTSGAAAARVLSALPTVIRVPADREPAPLRLIEAEIARDQPGQQAVLDRLLDLLLVATLRDWFALPEADPPPWYHAAGDPIVGTALRAIHQEPDTNWTVASLAAEVGVARATLARRFTMLLGESPIAYLTGWRLCLAADLLRDTDSTIETIAGRVGYSSAYALSTAFTREFGVRPSEHRRRVRQVSEVARP